MLDYAGEQPPQHPSGLKDTVYVPPNETVTLLVRFPDYPDPESPYMFHATCFSPRRGSSGSGATLLGQQTGSSAAKKNSVKAEQMA